MNVVIKILTVFKGLVFSYNIMKLDIYVLLYVEGYLHRVQILKYNVFLFHQELSSDI